MRPHLRLHYIRGGAWWVSGHHPNDRGYTLCSTRNFLDPRSACIAAKPMTQSIAEHITRTEWWAS